MKKWEIVLTTFYLCATAVITWVFGLVFLDALSPVFILLSILLLMVLMTVFLAWVRRLTCGARKRGFGWGLLVGLLSGVVMLGYAWRQGQLQDALLFLPISLFAVLIVLLLPFGLAWHLSTGIMKRSDGRERSTKTAQNSVTSAFWLAVLVAATQFFFCIGPWAQSLKQLEMARATSMKSRCRGFWSAVLSGSMEREMRGLPALWPCELGFTGNESSTDYFRRLMSNEAGEVTDDPAQALCSDLGYRAFGGPGLREATSALTFEAENNAWQVVCVDSNSPGWLPWLISRNADFGDWLTPTSQVRLIRSGPLNLRHVVWVTCGGGILDAHFKHFRVEMLFSSEDMARDTTAASMTYRIMRP